MMPLGWAAVAMELALQQASAGCAVDTDGDARRAEAGLVVGGTVVHRTLTLHEEGTSGTVRYLVRVERTWKGKVQSGYFALETTVGGGYVCPPDVVYDLNERVYAIGSPVDGGTLHPSPCNQDVGLWRESNEDWLADTARAASSRQARQGRTYAGAPPPLGPEFPVPLPSAGPQRIRVTSPGPVGPTEDSATLATPIGPVEGQVLRTGILGVQALFPLDEMVLALWVSKETLARVPLREISLVADGEAEILLQPGAPIALGDRQGEGFIARFEEGGLSATGWVAERDLGHIWTAQPPLEPLANALEGSLSLHASPGGKVVARLQWDEGLTWEATGPERLGWLPVRLHGTWVRAEGWAQPTSAERSGVEGGEMGGVSSVLELEPLVELRVPDSRRIFGQITAPMLATRLVAGTDWAYVAVDTPWGPMPAEVRCKAPLETRCQRR